MRLGTRLARLETQTEKQTAQTAYYVGTAIPVCTGDKEEDAFLTQVGCTRPFLNKEWYFETLIAVLWELRTGEWVHVHNTLHPALERRITWQELNVVALHQLENGAYIEKRLSSNNFWNEVRLTEQGRELLTEEYAA